MVATAARGTRAAGSRAPRGPPRCRSRPRPRGGWPRRRPRTTSAISGRDSAAGSAYPSKAHGGGRRVAQPPSSTGTLPGRPPRAGTSTPCGRRAPAGRRSPRPASARSRRSARQARACSSFQMPASSGVIRPSGTTRRGLGDDQAETAAGARRRGAPGASRRGRRRRGVLAHRGEPDAVADGQATQGDRLEQLGHGTPRVQRERSWGQPRVRPRLFPAVRYDAP